MIWLTNSHKFCFIFIIFSFFTRVFLNRVLQNVCIYNLCNNIKIRVNAYFIHHSNVQCYEYVNLNYLPATLPKCKFVQKIFKFLTETDLFIIPSANIQTYMIDNHKVFSH